jgi:hypothetical protein
MPTPLYYEPKGTIHFNVKYRLSGLDNRVLARHFTGCTPSEIEWVWIVEAARRATNEEIRQLCDGTWKGIS